jgi:hypothetical protein
MLTGVPEDAATVFTLTNAPDPGCTADKLTLEESPDTTVLAGS